MNHPAEVLVDLACGLYFVYMVMLVRRQKISLLDFFFSSIICIVPPLYVTFYFSIERVLLRLDIQHPFLVFFGSLIWVLFLYLSRVVILLHAAEKRQTRIVEELSLLEYEIRALKKSENV